MERKYTKEKIDEALQKWKAFSDRGEPGIATIASRLIDNQAPTSIFLLKSHRIFSFRPFPTHFYFVVDGRSWHPGTTSSADIWTAREYVDSPVVNISEMCYYCTYQKLLRLFNDDKYFNVLTNNCQRISDSYIFNTLMMVIYHVALFVFLYTGILLLFVVAIIILLLCSIYTYLINARRGIIYITCPHIRKHYK